ncbi:MAG: hypothetical protein RIG27_33205, partial [Coleofasciculus sp. F4-SAH-05]
MEQQLREREQWLATTLKSIGDAVITTRIARGYPFNEVRGRGIAENARGQSPKYFQSLSFYPMRWYSLAMKQVLTIVVKLQ